MFWLGFYVIKMLPLSLPGTSDTNKDDFFQLFSGLLFSSSNETRILIYLINNPFFTI